MIKAITFTHHTGASEFEKLKEFFSLIGFESGKGWNLGEGQGAPFLAPLGNLEFVTGRDPAEPQILVETTELESLHTIAQQWASKAGATVGDIEVTRWNSRLFVMEPAPGFKLGFWQSENPLKGKPVAIEGDLVATGMRFGIVVARWNAVITERLLHGSLDALHRSGVKDSDIKVVRVPGAFEIPLAARELAESGLIDAVITLGCLIRGETTHYEHIAEEATRGIGQSSQETGIPHTYGVLTCETLEQALDRAGLKSGNKGFEAAVSAIEMVSVARKIKDQAESELRAKVQIHPAKVR